MFLRVFSRSFVPTKLANEIGLLIAENGRNRNALETSLVYLSVAFGRALYRRQNRLRYLEKAKNRAV
jgi:hypothetical protein